MFSTGSIRNIVVYCFTTRKRREIRGERFILKSFPSINVASHQGCEAGAGSQALLDGWSRSQKLLDGGAGAGA